MAYERTIWQDGDLITQEKLNKLERGLANISSENLPQVSNQNIGQVLKVEPVFSPNEEKIIIPLQTIEIPSENGYLNIVTETPVTDVDFSVVEETDSPIFKLKVKEEGEEEYSYYTMLAFGETTTIDDQNFTILESKGGDFKWYLQSVNSPQITPQVFFSPSDTVSDTDRTFTVELSVAEISSAFELGYPCDAIITHYTNRYELLSGDIDKCTYKLLNSIPISIFIAGNGESHQILSATIGNEGIGLFLNYNSHTADCYWKADNTIEEYNPIN